MKGKKTDFFDWLVMGWVQSQDEVHPKDEPDLPIDRAADGTIRDRLGFFAERARRLFRGYSGLSCERFRSVAHLFALLPVLVVCFLGVFVFPVVNTNSILGDRSVNLIGPFGWFFGLQLLFMTLSLISLGLTLLFLGYSFVRNRFRRAAAHEQPSLAAERLGFLTGWIGAVVIRLWGRVMLYLGKRSAARISPNDEESSLKKSMVLFFHRVFSHQDVLFYYAGFLSHLFWFICSLVILLLLFNRMLGNRYDYCWNTSLSDTTQAEKVIQFFGRPVERFTTIPNKEHIRWLFDNSDRLDGQCTFPDQAAEPGRTTVVDASKMRKDWSWFLLAITACWTTLPRLVFALIYWFLCRCAVRRFRPRLDTPYYTGLLARYEYRPGRQESGKIDDDHLGPLQPLSPPSSHVDQNISPVPERSDRPRTVILCGYDLELSEKWVDSLLGQLPNLIFLGDLARRDLSSRRAKERLKTEAPAAESLILFLDLGYPPARQSHIVLRDEIFSCAVGARSFVVLSCAERLRRKFADNTQAVTDRLNDWRGVIGQIAEDLRLTIEVIDFYDHELDLPGPREKFLQRLGFDGGGTGEPAKKKFPDACRIIHDQTAGVVSEMGGTEPISRETITAALTEGYRRITELYREEKDSFFRSIPSIPTEQWKESVREHLSKLPGAAALSDKIKDNILSDTVKKPAEVLAHIRKIASGLSPKCALICGSAAAALPVLSLPLLGGALGTASAVALGYLPAAMLGSGTVGAAAGAVLPRGLISLKKKLLPFLKRDPQESAEPLPEESLFESSEAIETVAVSLTTWALLLELQNLPVDRRMEVLCRLTLPLEENRLDTLQAVDEVLEKIAAGVDLSEF
ncbi:MAG: DUF2868 domain-containing protein [Thermoguttaceae bacterium]|nr:DUF2868 domain-containing protein [Thermoguttaceae bacterium]